MVWWWFERNKKRCFGDEPIAVTETTLFLQSGHYACLYPDGIDAGFLRAVWFTSRKLAVLRLHVSGKTSRYFAFETNTCVNSCVKIIRYTSLFKYPICCWQCGLICYRLALWQGRIFNLFVFTELKDFWDFKSAGFWNIYFIACINCGIISNKSPTMP